MESRANEAPHSSLLRRSSQSGYEGRKLRGASLSPFESVHANRASLEVLDFGNEV